MYNREVRVVEGFGFEMDKDFPITPTAAAVLREVAVGNVVIVQFDDDYHEPTRKAIREVAEEYNLMVIEEEDGHVLRIAPDAYVSVIPIGDELPEDDVEE